jgi:hypothetical protein
MTPRQWKYETTTPISTYAKSSSAKQTCPPLMWRIAFHHFRLENDETNK